MDDGGRAILAQTAPPYYGAGVTQVGGWRAITRVVARRWRNVLATALALPLLTLGFLLTRPIVYESEAVVIVSAALQDAANSDASWAEAKLDDAAINTQLEVLNSRMLAGRVASALGLHDDPSWNDAAQDRTSLTPVEVVRAREALVSRMQSAIDVIRRGDSHVVTIRASAASARDAARIANEVANQYLLVQGEARAARLSRSLHWLSQRTNELQQEVQTKEAAVETYRARAGLVTSNGLTMDERQISEVQGSVITARADLTEREARLAEVDRMREGGGSAETVAGALSSETISNLRSREADVSRRLSELEERYGDRHPALRSVRLEREGIRSEISAEVARIASSAQNEVNIARSRLGALQSSLVAATGQMSGSNQALVRLNQLEREAAAARGVYEGFLQRRHVLAEQSQLTAPAAEIVSLAEIPAAPASRGILVAMCFALSAGLCFGLLVAAALEHFDARINTAEDVERLFGLPVLSISPLLSSRDLAGLANASAHPAGYLTLNRMSAFAEAFRVLRGALARLCGMSERAVVAVTSALPGDGKTTTSLCLARSTALSGRSVILIDCDLRRHALNHTLGIEPQRGIQDVLEFGLRWRDVVGCDEASGAHVLPSTAMSETSVDLFSGPRFAALLRELRNEYELVLLDCPPILSLAEARDVAMVADFTLVVVRSGNTPVPALAAALRQVQTAGGRLAGVMLNGVPRHALGRASYADPLYFTPTAKPYYESA